MKVKDIMNTKIISSSKRETIKEAIKKMKKHNISQMPVIDENKAVGFVSESIILNAISEIDSEYIEDIMEDSPPIITIDSDVDIIRDLLRFYPMILVTSHGKLKGLITKSDILTKLYK
jgi:predicted transcriptional regulator